MDVIFKTFAGLFFLMVLMVVGISVLFASLEAADADSFATSAADRIRAAYFDERVIGEVKKEAAENDYVLKVVTFTDEKTHEKFGICDVAYEYRIPLFSVNETFHVTSEMF